MEVLLPFSFRCQLLRVEVAQVGGDIRTLRQVRGRPRFRCLPPQRVFPWGVLPCLGPLGRCPGKEWTVLSCWPLLSSQRTGCARRALGGRPSCHPCRRAAGFLLLAPCRPSPWLALGFCSGLGGPPCRPSLGLGQKRNPCGAECLWAWPPTGLPRRVVRCHARLATCAI